MRRDLITSALAVIAFTVVLGLAYPLATTGLAQVLFPNKADGSRVGRAGTVVGSKLIGQDFKGDPRYFQSRPSVTEYNPAGTLFNNQGPNQQELRGLLTKNLATYLARERRYDPSLRRQEVPVDAVATSGSGVDPHISQANARIQGRRVAKVRGLSAAHLRSLIDESTDGRAVGVLGEPGVNVLELNLALDKEGA